MPEGSGTSIEIEFIGESVCNSSFLLHDRKARKIKIYKIDNFIVMHVMIKGQHFISSKLKFFGHTI
jgi:hypothetical protein